MQLEKILVILGPPGSGKGTQSKLLADKFGYGLFSMGDTLREYAFKSTDLGKKIKAMIDQGQIVTDDLAEVVAKETRSKYLDTPTLIMEGYPRTVRQAEVLEQFIKANNVKNLNVLSFQADKKKLIQRIIFRSQKEGRIDDASMESIEKRFSEYEDKTERILNTFRQKGKVIEINGDQTIQSVHLEILKKLGLEN